MITIVTGCSVRPVTDPSPAVQFSLAGVERFVPDQLVPTEEGTLFLIDPDLARQLAAELQRGRNDDDSVVFFMGPIAPSALRPRQAHLRRATCNA